jgi:hypothetical protein
MLLSYSQKFGNLNGKQKGPFLLGNYFTLEALAVCHRALTHGAFFFLPRQLAPFRRSTALDRLSC